MTQALAVNGFPFEIKKISENPYKALSEIEMLEKLEKACEHAAQNVLDAYDATIESLGHVAGSLRVCDNPRLHQLKYRRINFLNHRYFMLYRIEDDVVIIDNIFHELQDYENKMY